MCILAGRFDVIIFGIIYARFKFKLFYVINAYPGRHLLCVASSSSKERRVMNLLTFSIISIFVYVVLFAWDISKDVKLITVQVLCPCLWASVLKIKIYTYMYMYLQAYLSVHIYVPPKLSKCTHTCTSKPI